MQKKPLFYRDLNQSAEDTLVLIHGGFSNGYLTWRRQIDTLGEQYRLIICDRRGHGKSPQDPKPYTIAQDAQDIIAILKEIGIDSFHLVGHSYGGLVAIEVAYQLADKISTLHLLEPPCFSLFSNDPEVSSLNNKIKSLFEESSERGIEELAKGFFETMIGTEAAEHLRDSLAWQKVLDETERLINEEYPAEYSSEKITDLSLPIYIYTGGRSQLGLRKIAYETVKKLPTAKLIDIPEATHDLPRAQPRFDDALLASIKDYEKDLDKYC
ncbi:alpha/beta hydrolase [Natroniella sulfidigena]|uniref:alpha/beta fold hydrolase n=1 Tax=Natroniella sulfidigena TaxID=723921 RepID=UPI00200B5417|nr:alpha/beta hydrolase [Natroniella sulfidigena]MCK8817883.1 alpha/beta hydrolase [Natroniella sulfidigena]